MNFSESFRYLVETAKEIPELIKEVKPRSVIEAFKGCLSYKPRAVDEKGLRRVSTALALQCSMALGCMLVDSVATFVSGYRFGLLGPAYFVSNTVGIGLNVVFVTVIIMLLSQYKKINEIVPVLLAIVVAISTWLMCMSIVASAVSLVYSFSIFNLAVMVTDAITTAVSMVVLYSVNSLEVYKETQDWQWEQSGQRAELSGNFNEKDNSITEEVKEPTMTQDEQGTDGEGFKML